MTQARWWMVGTVALLAALGSAALFLAYGVLTPQSPLLEFAMIALLVSGMAIMGWFLSRTSAGKRSSPLYAAAFLTTLILSTVSLSTTFFGFYKFVSAQDAVSEQSEPSAARTAETVATIATETADPSAQQQNTEPGVSETVETASNTEQTRTESTDTSSQQQGSEQSNPQTKAVGSNLFPMFLAFGATFGIQLLMLLTALQLGDRFVKGRPTSAAAAKAEFANSNAPQIEQLGNGPSALGSNDSASREKVIREFKSAAGVGFLVLVCFAFVSGLGYISWSDFEALWAIMKNGQLGAADVSSFLIFILGAIVFFTLINLFLARRSFDRLITDLFLFTYLGALSVSWLFSFDSFYAVVQSPETADTERAAIVLEETSDILRSTDAELRARITRNGETLGDPETLAPLDAVTLSLTDLLNSNADEFREKSLSRRTQTQQALTNTETLLLQREAEIEALINEVSTRTQAKPNAAVNADALRQEQQQLQSELAAQNAALSRARAAAREFRAEEKAQEGGIGDRETGCGDLCLAARASAEEAEKEVAFLNSIVQGLQQQVAQVSVRLQQANIDQANASEEALSRLGDRRKTLEDDVDVLRSRRSELEQALAILADTSGNPEDRIVDVREAASTFKQTQSQESFDAFQTVCAGTAASLDGGSDINCSLPTVAAALQGLVRVQAQFGAFQETCAAGTLPTEVRKRVDQTRQCLVQAEASGRLNNQLTQLQSVFLTSQNDIRRAIINLTRGSQFAVGSAIVALLIDLFILLMGITVAANKSRIAYDDPKEPDPERTEALLFAFGQRYGSDPSETMARFLDTIQQVSDDENYPYVFRKELADEEKDLIDQICVTVGPTYFQRINPGNPDEKTAAQSVLPHVSLVEMAKEIAYLNQDPAASAAVTAPPIWLGRAVQNPYDSFPSESMASPTTKRLKRL